jgi:hypothetical protein
VHAREFDERSIPEPSQLGVVASDSDAQVIAIGSSRRIESSESTAEIAVVEVVASDGERQRGVRVSLESAGGTDEIYLDSGQAAQLRDELAGLEGWYERDATCEAIRYCVRGVARCRPSQSVRQAYCPSVYVTPEGEQGVILSTPRFSFRYPSMRAAVFVAAVDATIGELAGRPTNAEIDKSP